MTTKLKPEDLPELTGEDGLKPIGVSFKRFEELTSIKYATAWRMVRDGRLQVARIGGRTIVLWKSVEELFERSALPKGQVERSKKSDHLISTRSYHKGKSKLEGADAAD